MKKMTAMFLLLMAVAPLGMRPAFASDDEVSARLKAIEEKQDQILADLEALKSEVQVVKIRVTSR